MKEVTPGSAGLYKKIYRRIQRFLDSDVDVEVEPANVGFCVCFRHDMDRFDERNFESFVRLEETVEASSTLFFLESQFTRFPEKISQLDKTKYEIALHSEAKPTPFCISLHQLSRVLEFAYARSLRKQVRKFASNIGLPLGHAAHSVNNYLPFQGWINWNIIENASLRCRFSYVSDWRLPSRIAEGEEFVPAWPAYFRRRGGSSILVLPTSWDDKYFFYSYEDLHFRRLASEEVAYRDCSAKAAFGSVLQQVAVCRSLNTPFVLNIHPWHAACNGQNQFYDLKKFLIDWCNSEGVRIARCADIVSGISKC